MFVAAHFMQACASLHAVINTTSSRNRDSVSDVSAISCDN
jgi:hypothetical protein